MIIQFSLDKPNKPELYRFRGLYKIVNLVNGNWYIGSSRKVMKRFFSHRKLLRVGKHANHHLQNAYNMYGENNFIFEIIETSLDEDFAPKEQKIINEHFGKDYFYNMSKDAYAPMTGRKHSPETCIKLSIASKKRSKEIGECTRRNQLGRHHRPDSIEKMRNSYRGRDDSKRIEIIKSKEVRDKISKATKGKKMSSERYDKFLIMVKSESYRNKMSEVKSGIPCTEEMRRKASRTRLGKEIVFIKNGIKEIPLSIRDFCERKYKLDRHDIRKLINGEIEEYMGWRLYKEKLENKEIIPPAISSVPQIEECTDFFQACNLLK